MTNISKEIIDIQSIREIMANKFYEYAEHVIGDRALPDARDGLKPVHRRIIYDADELGLRYNSSYKKSARLVGDVLGKYHPHGDTAVYDSAVRMAQNFSLRYVLMDGHGNFGSVDGDSPAAMRYTEIRMSKMGQQLLKDIDKDTVDFKDNFDGSEQEPTVLPVLIPNLLANGSDGIAVGMSTYIPPHNLTELFDACLFLIENVHRTDIKVEELMQFVKGPDFPTAGTIVDKKDLLKAFKTGKGRVTLRGKYEIVQNKKDTVIYITELPYQVNKKKLIEKIDSLSKNDKIEGIKEINDESNKEGMSIAITLKRGADALLVMNKIIKHTDFQVNINYNMMALVNGAPMQLGLKECLDIFLAHCVEVITRRTQYDLNKVNARMFIIEGVEKALEDIETTIAIIRGANSAREGIDALIAEYEFEEVQAKYIWDLKINALSNFNTDKLEAEYNDLLIKHKTLIDILNDQSIMLTTLAGELKALKEEYGDERKTSIDLSANTNISEEDLIEDENLIVTISNQGLIKSVNEKEYNTQKRGGKGAKAATTKDDEVIIDLFTMNSKDDLLFITNIGRCHAIKAYKIPKGSKTAKGKSINNYITLQEGEYPVSIIATKIEEETSIVFVTKNGMIKRLPVTHLSSRHVATKVITIKDGDELVNALIAKENDNMLIATKKGMSIRIEVTNEMLRPMGRTAAGVKGIKVKDDDLVVDMTKIDDSSLILSITEQGFGKATEESLWKPQKRGGIGLKGHNISSKTGDLVACLSVTNEDEIFVGTEQGQIIRLKLTDIAKSKRDTAGTKMIKLYNSDVVMSASIAPIKEEDEQESEDTSVEE